MEWNLKMIQFIKNQRLLFRLILVILFNIILTIFILYLLLNHQVLENTQRNEEEQLLNMGEHLARQPLVIESLNSETSNTSLQNYTTSLQEAFDYDYVVIMTEDSVRLTHPNEELIYQEFQGEDQYDVFAGETYISTGEGTLGRSLRSFVPVYNDTNDIIGAVSIGLTTQNILQLSQENSETLRLSFVISIGIGLIIAFIVAYSLKKQMLDMEPHEIARVLEERNSMMKYTPDAMLVTSVDNEIILSNNSADNEFNLSNLNSIKIKNVLPFLEKNQRNITEPNNQETIYHYNEKDYIVSIAPIIVRENLAGRIFILRDATQMYSLTKQLYSTSEYAQTLESQNHDFLNKLHVIYGLNDLQEYGELKKYLNTLIESEHEFSERVAHLIHNPVVSGFLIGERRRFSENQIPLTIEISPDIPATSNLENTQPWIQFMTDLNNKLLASSNIFEIHLKLGYLDKQIWTEYIIKGEKEDILEWIKNQDNQKIKYKNEKMQLNVQFTYHYEA